MDNNFSNILNIFKKLDEGVMSEIDLELRDIVAREDFDALYDLFSANTPAGHYVQNIYQDVTIDTGLHPDDNFEEIEEIVFDRLADEFGGVDEGTPISTSPGSIDPGGATDNFKQQMANNTELKYQEKLKQIQGQDMEEGAKFDFAGEKRGQKPGDQWRGKDAGTPGNKLVGASESVSIAEELMNEWEQFLSELGATGTASAGGGVNQMGGGPSAGNAGNNAVDQQAAAKKTQNTQQNLNKLKSAGVNMPTSVSQATQTAIKATDNPTAIPTQTDKKVSMGLGQEMEKLLTTGNQNQVNQVATALKQAKLAGVQK